MKVLVTSIIDLEKTAHSRLHQIIKGLIERGHEVTVLSINDCWKSEQIETELVNEETSIFLDKISLKKFTNRKISPIQQEIISWSLLPKILNEINYKNFDIHFNYNTLFSGYYVAKKMRKINVNTVYDIADNLSEMIKSSPQINFLLRGVGGYLGNHMVKKNMEIAKNVTYITESLKNNIPIPNEKAVWIPNGVDIELFKKDHSGIRKELGVQDRFVIGFLGALREWVDFIPVFKAVEALKKKYSDISVLIVGGESERNIIKQQTREYNIQNQVIFKDTVPYNQVPAHINSMDVCLIPFVRDRIGEDSLPLKLFEYMACEKPVISTELEGVKEAVGRKILYASSKEEFMTQIVTLHNNSGLREEMGKNGREYVVENFSWSKILGKFENILEEAR